MQNRGKNEREEIPCTSLANLAKIRRRKRLLAVYAARGVSGITLVAQE